MSLIFERSDKNDYRSNSDSLLNDIESQMLNLFYNILSM